MSSHVYKLNKYKEASMPTRQNFFSLLLSLFFLISSTVNATPEVSLRDKIGQMLLIGFDGKSSVIGINKRIEIKATTTNQYW